MKVTRPPRRTKKGATSAAKAKSETDSNVDQGGVQTNNINAVAADELSTDAKGTEVESIDEVSVTGSVTDSDAEDAAWLVTSPGNVPTILFANQLNVSDRMVIMKDNE